MMDLKNLLNEEQILPVETLEGPVMVLAGAGSGKTRVLTYRIANLLEHGVDPRSILAITFTNKAAGEMKERIYEVTGVADMAISTFHSFCVKVLRQYIYRLGNYTNNFTIYDEEDSEKLINNITKAMFDDADDLKPLIKSAKFHISRAKTMGHDPQSYHKQIGYGIENENIIRIFEEYNKALVRNNAIDFDDILMLTVKLFFDHSDVLNIYQDRFVYIHVDEFQDTNKIQYLILKMLGQKYQNVFVVGDDDQSIYGWRGADYDNIKKFRSQFLGCRIFKLERNYRSSKNILSAANKLISENTDRMDKELWTENNEGAKIEYRRLYDEKDEADYVLGIINNLIRNSDYTYKDFAVLVRTTSITMALEDKLLLYNIPYRMIGGRKFYDRKEVKDFLAYLKIITNPRDEISILRVINVPKRGIGEGAIRKLKEACEAKNMTLFEGLINLPSLELSKATYTKMLPFAALITDFYTKKDMPLVDFVEYVNAEVDFTQIYDKDKEEDLARLENIEELIRSIKEFHKSNPLATLSEYLQSVTLMTSEDALNEDTNLLTVATVHGVKGLEFRCVFIIGLEENLFPIKRTEMKIREEEEERRIMYVAMTRAKERLFLTNAQSRYRFGSRINTNESSFIKEAGLGKSEQKLSSYFDRDFAPRKRVMDYSSVQVRQTPAFAKKEVVTEVKDKDISKFRVGQKIKHARFGEGEIINILGNQGDIQFPMLGVKKFNLTLAPIEIMD